MHRGSRCFVFNPRAVTSVSTEPALSPQQRQRQPLPPLKSTSRPSTPHSSPLPPPLSLPTRSLPPYLSPSPFLPSSRPTLLLPLFPFSLSLPHSFPPSLHRAPPPSFILPQVLTVTVFYMFMIVVQISYTREIRPYYHRT